LRTVCLLVAFGAHRASADDMAELRRIVGDCRAKIEHKTQLSKAMDGKPPMQNDTWCFGGSGGIVIRYNRYLNKTPHFTGQFPSLAGEMGIGFGDGVFYYWHGANAIRVLLNGVDVFAQQPAKHMEAREGDNGSLRLAWDLENRGELHLDFIVPEDAHAIYARIEIVPPELLVANIQLRLYCYPGGFGPAYRQPSHRSVATARGQWDVPRDFKADAKHLYPKVPLENGDDWVFYADKLASEGALGLLIDKAEGASGNIAMSNYGQTTEIHYPVAARQVHLALYAFETINERSRECFLSSLDRERRQLTSIDRQLDAVKRGSDGR
jgi:hypothetical protein